MTEIGVGMLGYAFMGKAHSNAFHKLAYLFISCVNGQDSVPTKHSTCICIDHEHRVPTGIEQYCVRCFRPDPV